MRVLMLTALVTLVAFAGCLDDDSGADADAPSTTGSDTGSSKQTWVFDAAGEALDASAFPGDLPTFEQVHVTQRISGEPTIGVSRTGAVFYPSIHFDSGVPGVQPVPTSLVFRSIDAGETWEDKSPHLMQAVSTHPTSFDPYIYVDPTTGRVFDMDMGPHVACNKVSWSDNDGDSWITREGACPLPAADHPTIFAGPKVGPAGALAPVTNEPTAYPNNVYLCSNQVADVQCSLSPDGGLTWLPSQPVFEPGVDALALAEDFADIDNWLCGSLTGHGHASWVDGTVYIGRGYCGTPMVGISRDGGLNWEVSVISDAPEHRLANLHDVSVGTDAAGNAYAFWLGDGDATGFLSVSTDQGATWGEPMNVTLPEVTAATFPSLVGGAEGRVAFQYVGTTTPSGWAVHPEAPGYNDTEETEAELRNATWNAYVTVAAGLTGDDPVFATTTINDPDKPLKRGGCWDRCKGDEGGMYDFLDLDIDPLTGQLWSALVDVCTEDCDLPDADATAYQRAYGTVGKQTGGLLLLDEPIPAA